MTIFILSEDKNIEAFFDDFIGVGNEFIHNSSLRTNSYPSAAKGLPTALRDRAFSEKFSFV
ncbi:MAG: hypothetical protein IPJ26_08005 [Bacteroidetes bacterium]|nr:hypothetical protein [Bacteroidota bacterium]